MKLLVIAFLFVALCTISCQGEDDEERVPADTEGACKQCGDATPNQRCEKVRIGTARTKMRCYFPSTCHHELYNCKNGLKTRARGLHSTRGISKKEKEQCDANEATCKEWINKTIGAPEA